MKLHWFFRRFISGSEFSLYMFKAGVYKWLELCGAWKVSRSLLLLCCSWSIPVLCSASPYESLSHSAPLKIQYMWTITNLPFRIYRYDYYSLWNQLSKNDLLKYFIWIYVGIHLYIRIYFTDIHVVSKLTSLRKSFKICI